MTLNIALGVVNGRKCVFRIDADSIRWAPVNTETARRKSCQSQKIKRSERSPRHELQQVPQNQELSANANLNASDQWKRIDFDHVIGVKSSPDAHVRGKSVVHLDKSNQEATIQMIKKVKVYYAKEAKNKSSGKLLKLKKLTIEIADHRLEIQDRPSLKQSSGKPEVVETGRASNCAQPNCQVAAGDATSARTASADSARNDSQNDEANSTVAPTGRVESLNELAELIQRTLELRRQIDWRPKRLLVFVNPYGGKGKAAKVFKRQARRLMELAQIEIKLVITQHANHARDTVEDPHFNVEYFDGIVCVGGDGMFSELMNGLLFRYNRDQISTQKSGSFRQHPYSTPPIPIGVIGAGSTDANSFGLIGTNDVITATLNIILGKQIDIDVCSIHSIREDRLLRFVSTFVAYGYFGDVIRESERLRWLGPSRYDITGVNNLIKNRTYKGKVKILRSKLDGSPMSGERCHVDCRLCWPDHTADDSGALESNKVKDELELIEVSGPFVGVNAAVTACRCPQTKKGFSPSNHLANGCADLIIVRPCSRVQYIQYLLRTGWTKKSAFDLKYVDAYRCREFEFHAEPSDMTDKLSKFTNANDNSTGSNSSASSVASSTNVNQAVANLVPMCSDSLESAKSRGQSATMSSQTSGGSYFSSSKSSDNIHADGSTSSWNVDGEILDEQSIRVKVNNRLLRVYGTGEPVM